MLHHRLTWDILSHGTPLRAEVEAFASGEKPLVAYPALAARTASWFFVPIAERRGEADHSIVSKKTVGRNVSGPSVSLALRLPEIEAMLSVADGAAISRMIGFFDQVRGPKDANNIFGFSRHPLLKGLVDRNERGEFLQTKSNCSWPCMAWTQRHSSPRLWGPRIATTSTRNIRSRMRPGRRQWRGRDVSALMLMSAVSPCASTVRRPCGPGEHIRCQRRVRPFWAFGQLLLPPIAHTLARRHRRRESIPPPPRRRHRLEREEEEEEIGRSGMVAPLAPAPDTPPALGDAMRKAFFRVLRKDVGRAKTVPILVASGGKLGTKSMAVTLHGSVWAKDGPRKSVEPLCASPFQLPVAIVDFHTGDAQMLEEGLESWSMCTALAYGLKDKKLPPVAAELLRGLVEGGAFAGAGRPLHVAARDVATLNVLSEWRSSGLVEQTQAFADSSSWCLSAHGMVELSTSQLSRLWRRAHGSCYACWRAAASSGFACRPSGSRRPHCRL